MVIDDLTRAFLEAFRPPPKLTLSEWADEHAVLSAESSAEAGRWKTIPYQKGIMDAFTDPAIEQVSVMKSARVGWTKIINHVIGYHIHQDPCSIMVVQPTIEDAEGYSKEEIAPMLRDTPVLQDLVSESKAKSGDNTILSKMYPGGTLGLVGANSPRGFRRVSRRVVLFDECDGYPVTGAGNEGDQIKLGIRRTEYFWNRKIGAGSTPTLKDFSKIEKLFNQSDQRRYFVPCPQCEHMDYLVFRENRADNKGVQKGHWMKWPDDQPEAAHFVCSKNGCIIPHEKKRWMVENGMWIPTASGSGKHAGFHIWAAYSYSPNASWGQLALEFLEAKASGQEELKTFINTALGELWEESVSQKLGAEGLKARSETYTPSVVPARALAITCGVDVQDNRLAYSVYGWGVGEESWLIDHAEIFGDPGQSEVWKQLDNVILRPWKHELGGEMKMHATCVDSGGHYTNEVYVYCRERRKHRVLAIKGQSQKGKPPIGKPTKQDIDWRGQTLKWGVDLYPVGSDTIKTTLYSRMRQAEPGPGYIHFHAALPDDFYQQITAEKKVTRYVKGFPVSEWVLKPGTRNEALDCAVYASAAKEWLYTRYHRKTIWDQLERALQVKGVPVPEPETPPQQVTEQPANTAEDQASELQRKRAARNIGSKRRSGGFVTRW